MNTTITPVFITFSVLVLSICAAWIKPIAIGRVYAVSLWMPFLLLAIVSGLSAGYLTWPALVVLGIFGLSAHVGTREAGHPTYRALATAAVVLIASVLAMHKMPGFHNPLLLDNFKFSPDAVPYSHYANFDKAAAGLIVLVFYCTRAHGLSQWRGLFIRTLPVALITCAVVISTGLLMGYSRPDFKFPAHTPIYLVTNLFFTCVAEEALFRGLLQPRLMRFLETKNVARGGAVALMCTSILFGIVHTGGGLGYVVLATLAGLGYGYAFIRTQRIESSILVHFSVNAVHFLGFTYPRLA